jgi:hypothetical protein
MVALGPIACCDSMNFTRLVPESLCALLQQLGSGGVSPCIYLT